MFEISSAFRSDLGRKRSNNQDFVAFFEPNEVNELQTSGCLYIVADGVGGATDGHRASRYAAQKVLFEYYRYPQLDPAERLRRAMRQAGNQIYQYARESDPSTRMATTMVAVAIRGNSLTVANVGDSRVYLIRNSAIKQITQDHSLIGELTRNGTVTEEDARSQVKKNTITRSLGGEIDVVVDIFSDIVLEAGDKVLLCSDGLTRYASPRDLVQLTELKSVHASVDQMIEFANRSGGADNSSVILVEVGRQVDSSAATQRGSRGQTPTPIDWETMETSPNIAIYQNKKRRNKFYTQLRPWLLGGAILVILAVVIGITYFLGPTREETPAQITPTFQAVESTPTAENPLPMIAVTNTPMIEVAIAPSEIFSGTLPETSDNQENILAFCVYSVQGGESPWSIGFTKLQADIRGTSEIKLCLGTQNIEDVSGPSDCQVEATEIVVQPGDLLLIPNVPIAICEKEGGRLLNPISD